jgi:hypothetical protein
MVPRTPAKKTFYLKDHLKSCTLCSRISCTLYSRINCTVWSRILKYRDRKVCAGMRTFTIGGITIRLIYLNAQLPQRKDKEIRKAILKCIININKDICDPPLTFKEVLMSFNANWKKYEDDELDFSRYFTKQKCFWSRNCDLNGDEKRRITCKIKNEPIVAASRKKIEDAIEDIHLHGKKITQKNVALCSGLKLPTIKKYWKHYKQKVKELNQEI